MPKYKVTFEVEINAENKENAVDELIFGLDAGEIAIGQSSVVKIEEINK
jgi:hypothetical protein